MLCGAPLIVQVMQSTSTDLLIFGSSNTVPYSAWSNCLNWSVFCSNLLAFALRLPSLNPRDPLLGNLFSHIWTFKVSCSSNHSNFFHTWRAYPHAVSESSALNIWRSCLGILAPTAMLSDFDSFGFGIIIFLYSVRTFGFPFHWWTLCAVISPVWQTLVPTLDKM